MLASIMIDANGMVMEALNYTKIMKIKDYSEVLYGESKKYQYK